LWLRLLRLRCDCKGEEHARPDDEASNRDGHTRSP
jgi:hypothetical protein